MRCTGGTRHLVVVLHSSGMLAEVHPPVCLAAAGRGRHVGVERFPEASYIRC